MSSIGHFIKLHNRKHNRQHHQYGLHKRKS